MTTTATTPTPTMTWCGLDCRVAGEFADLAEDVLARTPCHPPGPTARTADPKEPTMSKTTDTLISILADTYALAVKTHSAHWNVTGPQFFSLHDAFGSQYEALLEVADDIAERVRALGAKAPHGLLALAKATSVEDIADNDGLALAKSLRNDHRALSKACAKAVKAAQEAGDEATADLLIGRIEAHDKTAWMLDAAIA